MRDGMTSLHYRSIPARAGEPFPYESALCWYMMYSEVYPRACGGTSTTAIRSLVICCSGLSPRVRGNLMLYGILAARVEVYPRACGGTRIVVIQLSPARGSGLSPRVRGNLTMLG